MRNNAHMEEKEKRIKRFENGCPTEIISTLINSIPNFFNNEIRLTIKDDNYQTSLMFMGVHAVALTISEGLFGVRGLDGYRLFLETFMDGDTPDTKFSAIAGLVHKWRNVVAHQWLGSVGHSIGYDYTMNLGWEKRGEVTYINPRIYCEHYLKVFGSDGPIYSYDKKMTTDQLEAAHERLLRKFIQS